MRRIGQRHAHRALVVRRRKPEHAVLPRNRGTPRRSSQMDLRTYGIGAQILRDLGVAKMRLLGSPRRMPSMTGYGLEVTGFVTAED